ncbi:MAG: hypothetical protein DRQ78_01230 [Epsilonproteobacteria bacterium]|nr:MAG: hypothetical protein DRQ78_01230 [Campylobacterota bacterium]
MAPKDLDRLYASGRIKKVQYIMGKLMKVYPIVPVINGSVNDTGTVKARGVEAATKKVAELVDAKQKEIEAEGYETVV